MIKKRIFALACATVMVLSMVGCGSTKTENNDVALVTNPITTYNSVSELKTAIGFSPLELASSVASDYTLASIEKYDGDIAELEYESKTGNKDTVYIVRTAKSGTDITGMYDVNYTKVTINGKEVSKGKETTSYVAFWSDGSYTYVLYGAVDAMDESKFTSTLEAMVK